MAIQVRPFAAFAELIGVREFSVEYSAGMNCADLWKRIATMYPKIGKISPLFAVNDEYIPPETELQDGASVMLFPPVSGG